MVKVKGTENPADILTKYVSADMLEKMLKIINLRFLGGRSSVAPELPPETADAITANTGKEKKEATICLVAEATGIGTPRLEEAASPKSKSFSKSGIVKVGVKSKFTFEVLLVHHNL